MMIIIVDFQKLASGKMILNLGNSDYVFLGKKSWKITKDSKILTTRKGSTIFIYKKRKFESHVKTIWKEQLNSLLMIEKMS